MYRYLNVLSVGPLMAVRLPTEPKEPRWRSVLKALTPIMRAYGLRQKDICGIESLIDPDSKREADVAFTQLVARAFEGGSGLPKFALYDWRDGQFVLVRARAEH